MNSLLVLAYTPYNVVRHAYVEHVRTARHYVNSIAMLSHVPMLAVVIG